jgi:hypothetical protein
MYLLKPDPVIRNIIGASAARAQQNHPVKLWWLECNINHEQTGIGPIDDSRKSLTNVALFKQTFHRIAAEEINRYLEREGPLYSTASRDVECLDNESVQRQFEYALTNPVKDGLIDRIANWDGFSSYDYRQAAIRRRVRELEQAFRENRDRPAMTPAQMKRIDHRDRPKTKPERTRKPLCHAATKEAEKQYREAHREFLNAYIVASAAYRSGAYNTEFPAGSFRPPLIVAFG